MQETTETWNELRSILAEPSSPLTFRALLALLDTWPADDGNEAIEFAARSLESWPDSDRLAPWSMGWSLAEGHSKPTWDLVRRLELDRRPHEGRYGPDGDIKAIPFSKIAGLDELRSVSELLIDAFGDGALAAFRDTVNSWSNLKVFHGEDNLDFKLKSLASLSIWDQIHELHAGSISDDLWHSEASYILPKTKAHQLPLEAVTLPALDLIALWDKKGLPRLSVASVFIRKIDEAEQLAQRPELANLVSLELAFRCGRDGRAWHGAHTGNVIPKDDEAATTFFKQLVFQD